MNYTWNGDVWKVPYYLASNRPDLKFFTLNCDWGLGGVTGFSPDPPQANEDVISKVKDLDYAVLDKNREEILKLRNPLYSWYYFSRRGSASHR